MSRPEDRTVIVSPKQPPRAAMPAQQRRSPVPTSKRPQRRPAIHGGLWLAIAIGCGFGASFALTLRLSRPSFNPVATILQSEQDFPEAPFPGTNYQALENRYGAVSIPRWQEDWAEPPSTAIVPESEFPAAIDTPELELPETATDPSLSDSASETLPPLISTPTQSASEPSWSAPSSAPAPSAPIAPEPLAPTPTAPPLQ